MDKRQILLGNDVQKVNHNHNHCVPFSLLRKKCNCTAGPHLSAAGHSVSLSPGHFRTLGNGLQSGLHTPKRESRDRSRYWYTHVHRSLFTIAKNVAATQESTDRQTDKQNVIRTHSGKLFTLKKEENSDTCLG